ncbi:hypothetical protein VDGD_03018 [Verticillium dahliae]|nr:hypothetical protein VDGD_03018 [Verticillium dahliae]
MSSQTAAQANPRKQQELQNQYTVYKNTLQQIAQKIGDVEQEAEEHKLVLETLQPLSGDRKAFRLINGVLMEQTVQDVMPALKTNSEGLKKVLEDLVKQYKTKQDELEKWKVCMAPLTTPGTCFNKFYRRSTIFKSSSREIWPITCADKRQLPGR